MTASAARKATTAPSEDRGDERRRVRAAYLEQPGGRRDDRRVEHEIDLRAVGVELHLKAVFVDEYPMQIEQLIAVDLIQPRRIPVKSDASRSALSVIRLAARCSDRPKRGARRSA